MFFFSYIRKLFLVAFPRPVMLGPPNEASFPRGAVPGNSLNESRAFAPQPLSGRAAAAEPNLAAPLLLQRFRIGPYANGPP